MENAFTYRAATVVLLLTGSLSATADAQSPQRGWLGVDFGPSLSATRHFSITTSSTRSCCDAVVTTRDLRSDFQLKTARAIGVDAGFFVTGYLGLRAASTSVSREGPGSLSIQDTNMWGSPGVSGAGVFGVSRHFRRDEDSIEIGPVAMFPISTRIQGRVFGGPTYFRIGQELMTNVDIIYEGDEGYRPYWERPFAIPIRDVRYDVEKVDSSAWGYHVGGAITLRVAGDLGVGATVCYGAAGVDLNTNLDPTFSLPRVERVKTGGWSILSGTSLRF